MSYAQAVKFSANHRKRKAQYMGFSALEKNQRRRTPWLGSAWFEPGMDEERRAYIAAYQAETERLLRENPDLEIVD